MTIEGKISILISRDSTTIEVRDANASVTFARIKLTPEQLSEALARTMYTDCSIEVHGLDKIGKTHESETFVFEIPPMPLGTKRDEKELQALAQSQLSDGWVADFYFGSQNSFFRKDGKDFARVTIRRWK